MSHPVSSKRDKESLDQRDETSNKWATLGTLDSGGRNQESTDPPWEAGEGRGQWARLGVIWMAVWLPRTRAGVLATGHGNWLWYPFDSTYF